MATSKVVTVTAASVGTGDTLASYNIYSDQDGLLDNASVAEATAGHTVSLSDGVVHSVTVKPVGASSGEYNAASNAVSVDLSGGGGTLTFSTLVGLTESPTGTFINNGGGTHLTSYAVSNRNFCGSIYY